MPIIGPHISIKTGIIAEISVIRFMGEPVYMCEINERIYKMTQEEFNKKWKKCDGKRGAR